ncbi:MAG: hypothetical protein AB8H80_01045 [Planctomycetota bacterium]
MNRLRRISIATAAAGLAFAAGPQQSLLCQPPAPQPPAAPAGSPSVEELDKAKPEVIRILADGIVSASNGDHRAASGKLIAAAMQARERAAGYLLWQQAIELAVRHGDIWLALQHARSADFFDLDEHAFRLQLLRRLAKSAVDPARLANVATSALYAAGDEALHTDERRSLAYYDIALRSSLRSGHAPLYSFVRDRLPMLRGPRELGARFDQHVENSPWKGQLMLAGLLAGEGRMLEPFTLGDLEPLFDFGDAAQASQPARDLDYQQLLAASERCQDPRLREGLLRCAQQQIVRGYQHANEATRRTQCTQLVQLTERLCRIDGLSRLRFARATDRDALCFGNGNWRVDDNRLIGKAQERDNYATHRVAFASANVVLIRGGLLSEQGLNFRCKVGDINLLLNWEVEPQNHLWQNGTCLRQGPPALSVGEEHTILLFSDGTHAHVCIDGNHMWSVQSDLGGTITIYPAFGSEIFVRELLVDGTPTTLVDGPKGVMM